MKDRAARVFVSAVLVLLAYEWLISGFNKVLAGNFISELHHEMSQALSDIQYPFYVQMLQRFFIPHSHIVGILVEAGEILMGLSCLLLATFVLTSWRSRTASILGVVTGIIGAFVTLNFFFYQSGSFFINTDDPFDEGISLDLFMTVLQVFLVVYFWGWCRKRRY